MVDEFISALVVVDDGGSLVGDPQVDFCYAPTRFGRMENANRR